MHLRKLTDLWYSKKSEWPFNVSTHIYLILISSGARRRYVWFNVARNSEANLPQIKEHLEEESESLHIRSLLSLIWFLLTLTPSKIRKVLVRYLCLSLVEHVEDLHCHKQSKSIGGGIKEDGKLNMLVKESEGKCAWRWIGKLEDWHFALFKMLRRISPLLKRNFCASRLPRRRLLVTRNRRLKLLTSFRR